MEKCCGKCKNHFPKPDTSNNLNIDIRCSRKAWWFCGLTGVKKKHTDGVRCDFFENRYENRKTLEEWRRGCNRKEKKDGR